MPFIPSPFTVSITPSSDPALTGQLVTFTATVTGGTGAVALYQWHYNNSESNFSSPSTTFPAADTYDITLRVWDSGTPPQYADATYPLVVNDPASLSVELTGDPDVANSGTTPVGYFVDDDLEFTLTITDGLPPFTPAEIYLSGMGDAVPELGMLPGVSADGSPVVWSVNLSDQGYQPGTYFAWGRVRDATDTWADSSLGYYDLYDHLTAAVVFAENYTLDVGDDTDLYVLTGELKGIPPLTYLWSVTGGSSATGTFSPDTTTGPSNNFTATGAGTCTITCVVTDDRSEFVTGISATITVPPPPPPPPPPPDGLSCDTAYLESVTANPHTSGGTPTGTRWYALTNNTGGDITTSSSTLTALLDAAAPIEWFTGICSGLTSQGSGVGSVAGPTFLADGDTIYVTVTWAGGTALEFSWV